MHAQSGAERQRRARIIESEGERTATQNYSEGAACRPPFQSVSHSRCGAGKRQADINQSEGARQQAINIAEGLCDTLNMRDKMRMTHFFSFQRSVIEAQATAAGSVTLAKAHTEAIKKFTSVGVPADEASLLYLTLK